LQNLTTLCVFGLRSADRPEAPWTRQTIIAEFPIAGGLICRQGTCRLAFERVPFPDNGFFTGFINVCCIADALVFARRFSCLGARIRAETFIFIEAVIAYIHMASMAAVEKCAASFILSSD
jgi:hypothetical protein